MDDDFFQRRVGSVLCGKWTLERLLGVGGMAAVYVGRHHIGHRDAIKILHPTAGRSKEMRARFEQEAHAVARLAHPGAVRIDDIDTAEDGSLFLVMELLEGETLAERATRAGCPPIEEVLRWVDTLLDVLIAAHALGIVHRDIKPDNVFLTSDGRVKLLDFGIARMRDVQRETLRTATGVALGTLPFMPPEQVRGLPIDARADLFALAATVVRLVAGRHLHDAGSDTELMLKMATEPAPPVKALAPNLAADVCAVFDRALSFDREQRHPDAAAMQADVRALRAGRPLAAGVTARAAAAPLLTAHAVTAGAPGPVAAAREPPPSRRALPLMWVLGGSILAGCFATGAILWAVTDGEGAGEAQADAVLASGDASLEPASTVAPGDGPRSAGRTPAGATASPVSPAATIAPARPTSPQPGQKPGAQPGTQPGTQPTAPPPSTAPAPPPQKPPREPDDDERKKDRGKEKKEKDRGKKGKGKGDD